MKYTMSVAVLLISGFMAAASLSAQSDPSLPLLDDALPFISLEDRDTLVRNGEYRRFHPDGVSPNLLPNTTFTASIVREMIAGDLNIGIENLFFVPLSDLPSGYARMTDDERSLKLYNILRSVSTLTGLEYYSASRDKMRLLFVESWAIENEDNPVQALPDPLVSEIPEKDSIIVHQKDKTFGKFQSAITFRAQADAFSTSIVNLSVMRYKGIIRLMGPGEMQTHLVVVPVQEGLLIYGTIGGKVVQIKSAMGRARDSFTNRIIALTEWYKTRLNEEFRD